MVLVVVCCWLLMCQTASVRPDGITLPITSIVYKSSPIDQKPLSVSFTPNACNESPTTYSDSRSLESVSVPTKPQQESCSIQESQPPFNTVSISTPLNPAIDKPLQIQGFSGNAFTPQTSTFPQIDFSYVESNNVMTDCTRESVPPVVQYQPGYIVTSADDNNNKMKVPLVPVTLDNLPSNVYKVKLADSKPIFIDCSKQSSYQIPTNPVSVNTYVMQSVANPIPTYEVVQNSVADYLLNQGRDDYTISQASAVFIEKPVTYYNPNNNVMQQQLINKATEPQPTEISASTGNVVYPIRNVIFDYSPNCCNQFQTANAQSQPIVTPVITPPKVTPVLIPPKVTPVSPENVYCYCNNMNMLPTTSTPCLVNQVYTCGNELPIASVSQLPNVNAINKPSLRSPNLPCPIPASVSYDTTSNSFASQLSSSLNNIISLLTAGLISSVFGNTTPECKPDIVPAEAIYLKEPVMDIPTTFMNTDKFVSNPSFACPPPIIDVPVNLPSPEIDLSKKDFGSRECLKSSSAVCTQKAPKCKPYLASVTINIMPSSDTANDIIIVI